METTEKIVESYCRYVKGWLTLPNIRCSGQKEIDLLAVSVSGKKLKRYHIESGVSISGSYSKLTAKEFSPDKLKERVHTAGQRRTLGYFHYHKFENEYVLDKLKEYGFKKGNYTKIIVSWGWTPKAEKEAQKYNIELWDFRDLLLEIGDQDKLKNGYFLDDTLRTIQLYQKGVNFFK